MKLNILLQLSIFGFNLSILFLSREWIFSTSCRVRFDGAFRNAARNSGSVQMLLSELSMQPWKGDIRSKSESFQKFSPEIGALNRPLKVCLSEYEHTAWKYFLVECLRNAKNEV